MEKLNILAQSIENPQIISPINALDAGEYSTRVYQILFYVFFSFCVIAFLLMILIGGYQWVTCGGAQETLAKARSRITNGVTGLVILLLLFFGIRAINTIFDINFADSSRFGSETSPFTPPTLPPDTVLGNCIYTASTNSCDCVCPTNYVPDENCVGDVMTCGGDCDCVQSPEVVLCEAGGGTWQMCPSSCGDLCVQPELCLAVLTPCCDCGDGYCWDGSSCIPDSIANGGSCTANSQCASGLCASTADNDSDTFHPAYVSGTGVCVSALDCNDANNLVFPGQTQYFQDPISGSTTNFDYDCNGTNNRWPRLNCLRTGPSATCQTTPIDPSTCALQTGWNNFIPACGETFGTTQTFYMCTSYANSTCTMSPGVVSEFGCFTSCITENYCGYGQDQPCISWNVNWWYPYASYFEDDFPGGLYRMPCK